MKNPRLKANARLRANTRLRANAKALPSVTDEER